MKGFLGLALVAVSGSAMASFELMYLPDATTGRVWRYDPVNNVVLGSFGPSGLSGANTSVSAGTVPGSKVLVTRAGGITRYDGGTGVVEQHLAVPTGRMHVAPSGNRAFESFGSTVFRYQVNSLNSFSSLSFGTNLTAAVGINDNFGFVTFLDGTGSLMARSFDFVSGSLGTVFNLVASNSISSVATLTGQSTVFFAGGSNRIATPFIAPDGSLRVSLVQLSVSNTVLGVSNFGVTNFAASTVAGVVAGHDSFYVIGRDATSPTLTRVSQYAFGGLLMNTTTTGAFQVPTSRWSGASVVAPEPGTMLALGAGLAAILRRRRARG